MKLKKTVKKIAALGVGLGMMGATLLGAVATADLANYPSMFINTEGKFDGVFVVGKNAKAEDIIGQSLLASSIQSVAIKKVPIAGATATKTISGEKTEFGNKELYLNKSVGEVDSKFTDSDLPTLLKKGSYVDNEGVNKQTTDYEQKLYVPTHSEAKGQKDTLRIMHEQDDDAAPNSGVYLFIDDSSTYYTYNYTMKFDTPVLVDNTSSTSMSGDIEGTVMKIMGKDFTVVDIKYDTNDLKELKFLGGESVMWMSQGEKTTTSIDGTEHTIEMVDVTEVSTTGEITSCGFLVDGQSVWVDVGATETTSGVVIGVTDGKAIHSEKEDTDVCKVSIGAKIINIRDNAEIKIGDKKIRDVTDFYAMGYIDYNPQAANSAKMVQWGYAVNPDKDDLYLKAGDEMVDPVFGTIKIVFSELVEDAKEKIGVKTSGKTGEITFVNKDGKDIKINLKSSGDSSNIVYLGKTTTSTEVSDMMYLENTSCKATTSVSECKGAKFIVSAGSNCEAHLIRVSSIDLVDTKISFEDLTYGSETNDYDYTAGTAFDPGLSGVSDTIGMSVGATDINFTNLGTCYYKTSVNLLGDNLGSYLKMKTKNEGFVYLNYTSWAKAADASTQGNNFTHPRITNASFAEYYDTGSAIANSVFLGETNNQMLQVDFIYDTGSDNVLELVYDKSGLVLGTSDTKYAFAKNDMSDTDDDNRQTMTFKGTWVTIDDDSSKQSIVIEHPKRSTYGKVFFAATESAAEVSTAGTYTTEIQQIGVDQFKLDTEVADPTAVNVIAVGGPCANSVVSALMGNPADCVTAMGIEAGQGMLKLFEDATTAKIALVIAGQTAEDTRLASQMIANYGDYALKGDEVVAITVSASELSWKTKAEVAAAKAAAEAAAAAPVAEETVPAAGTTPAETTTG